MEIRKELFTNSFDYQWAALAESEQTGELSDPTLIALKQRAARDSLAYQTLEDAGIEVEK